LISPVCKTNGSKISYQFPLHAITVCSIHDIIATTENRSLN